MVLSPAKSCCLSLSLSLVHFLHTHLLTTKSYKYTQFKYEKEESFSYSNGGLVQNYQILQSEERGNLLLFESNSNRSCCVGPRFFAFSSLSFCLLRYGCVVAFVVCMHCWRFIAGFWMDSGFWIWRLLLFLLWWQRTAAMLPPWNFFLNFVVASFRIFDIIITLRAPCSHCHFDLKSAHILCAKYYYYANSTQNARSSNVNGIR